MPTLPYHLFIFAMSSCSVAYSLLPPQSGLVMRRRRRSGAEGVPYTLPKEGSRVEIEGGRLCTVANPCRNRVCSDLGAVQVWGKRQAKMMR